MYNYAKQVAEIIHAEKNYLGATIKRKTIARIADKCRGSSRHMLPVLVFYRQAYLGIP
jgi:Holliday junction resolvasome RuvABC ATP-dependent DNA helicase subunit